jgi:hypothetical protein
MRVLRAFPKPQTGAEDDPDVCTSPAPTPPDPAARKTMRMPRASSRPACSEAFNQSQQPLPLHHKISLIANPKALIRRRVVLHRRNHRHRRQGARRRSKFTTVPPAAGHGTPPYCSARKRNARSEPDPEKHPVTPCCFERRCDFTATAKCLRTARVLSPNFLRGIRHPDRSAAEGFAVCLG